METSKVELFPVARRRLAPLYKRCIYAYVSIRLHTSAYVELVAGLAAPHLSSVP
jgi:hypothetical protein